MRLIETLNDFFHFILMKINLTLKLLRFSPKVLKDTRLYSRFLSLHDYAYLCLDFTQKLIGFIPSIVVLDPLILRFFVVHIYQSFLLFVCGCLKDNIGACK